MTAGEPTGLRVEGLRHRRGARVLLDGVDLRIGPGDSVAVTGPDGAATSALLHCLLGLVTPDAGSVRAGGRELTGATAGQRARARRQHMGTVFPYDEPLPELTPVENVALPLLLDGGEHGDAYRRAAALLNELGVPQEETPAGLLTHGERRRTAVARALITGPDVLLADEPTAGLDPPDAHAVAELLFAAVRERGGALLVVTRDPSVAARAGRTLRLDAGMLTHDTAGVGA
ncbi:ATP-binding cassette domain-containing protein [Streptomyces sp. NBC_01456]|uniref:ABC transporter ATP-binding protein n=1 Tax=unclassified Streptomyces TaxID=2593676 RepID=UPI002E37FACB|nr:MULTISPECIES: ATP-binding cassette domain-containing protein [unclassified Streptomyces]